MPSSSEKPSLTDSLSDYVSARAELFSIECKEASNWAQKRGKAFGIALVCFLFGYGFFLVSLCAIIGAFIPPLAGEKIAGWMLVSAILGLLHIIIAIIFLKSRNATSGAELFSYTRTELKKDRQWIKNSQ